MTTQGRSDGRLQCATPRLRLVALDEALAGLQLRSPSEFFRALNVSPEAAWPPELHDRETMANTFERLSASPDETGWHGWAFIMRWADDAPGRLVGAGGFYGAPDGDGMAEIGYSMLPSFREQGLATEAVKGLVDWALGHEAVTAITARTPADGRASRRVLEKAGFRLTGEVTDPDDGPLAVYTLARKAA